MRTAILAATVTMLAGCGTYSETGLASQLDDQLVGQLGISRSGVTDTPLAADAYRIRGYGNQNASFEKTNAVALVRAAALASEHGHDLFSIVNFDVWQKTTSHTTPVTAHTSTSVNLNANSYGGYIRGHANSTTTFSGGETYTLDRPRTDIVVQFVPNDSPEAPRALRVADVIARYGKKAGLKPAEAQAILAVASSGAAVGPQRMPAPEAAPAVVATYEGLQAPALVTPVIARQDGPTLDKIYKALSPPERARVNSLPPAERANYLSMVRDRN